MPLFYYVSLPSPEFPKPPAGFVQSFEPADVESTFRRGYYTNLSRAEVITHYEKEFNKGFGIFTPRLNYPPEEAQAIIRDQTKSTFLEEIVHHLRESLYINGFEPKTEEYVPVIDGVRWRHKVIVKYIPSLIWIREIVLVLSFVSTLLLIREIKYAKNI